jgi:hypothetical protein
VYHGLLVRLWQTLKEWPWSPETLQIERFDIDLWVLGVAEAFLSKVTDEADIHLLCSQSTQLYASQCVRSYNVLFAVSLSTMAYGELYDFVECDIGNTML